jgi:hypothetical protein
MRFEGKSVGATVDCKWLRIDLSNLFGTSPWYRGWAELGNDKDGAWQSMFAEYLERRATEIGTLLACASRRAAH